MFKRKLSGHLLAKSHGYVYMYMYNLYAKHLSVTQEISNRIFSCWPAKIVENSFNDIIHVAAFLNVNFSGQQFS